MRALFLLILISCSAHKKNAFKLPPGEKFLSVPSGKVHTSCLNKHGGKLLSLIERSRKTGLECLKQLDTPTTRTHADRLNQLFQSKKLAYYCSESGSDWEDQAAHASVSSADDNEEFGYHHPFISLQPKLVVSGELQELIFHEYFHNTGSLHGFTIEYPYACAECCFPRYQKDSLLACRICQGSYSGVEDEKYIRDFWEWSEDSPYKKFVRRDITLRTAIFKKTDTKTHWRLYLGTWDRYNLVAHNLAQRLAKKWKDFTPELSKFSTAKSLRRYDGFARVITEGQLQLYGKKNMKRALQSFRKVPFEVLKSVPEKNFQAVHNMWLLLISDIDFMVEYLKDHNQTLYQEAVSLQERVESVEPKQTF